MLESTSVVYINCIVVILRSQRKIEEYGEKLLDCCNSYDPFELCRKIRDIITSGGLKDGVITVLWSTVASIGFKQSKPSTDFLEIVRKEKL